MLSVAQAHQRLFTALAPTEEIEVPLRQAAGLVLAADAVAAEDAPRFANSAMDGFALRAKDVEIASKEDPATLDVVGDIPAGVLPGRTLEAGQAMRIMTGAVLPAGADAVAPVEDTDIAPPYTDAALPTRVAIGRALSAGDYVRQQGEDFGEGDVLLQAGAILRPQEIALLAMLGNARVRVHRRPRIALLSSGDELVEVDQKLSPGKIRESNSYALAALAADAGAEAFQLGIAPDKLETIKAYLDRAVDSGTDLILSSAGVSVGAFDYLREAVLSDGELDFWRVNMRPGKPLAFGSYRQIPFIGLPGNPVSAFVGFEVFVRPAIRFMAGQTNWARRILQAQLAQAVESDGRESFLRGRFSSSEVGYTVELTGHQGSGNLYSLVQANCLVRIPADKKSILAGSSVEIWPL